MAIGFDGVDDRLFAGSVVAGAAPVALSCWFRVNSGGSGIGSLVTLCGDANIDRFDLGVLWNGQLLRMLSRDSGSGSSQAVSDGSWSTGVWHHALGVVRADDDRQVWLDGVAGSADSADATPANIGGVSVGAALLTGPFNYFGGAVADVAVWSGSGVEAFGDAEAALLASAFSPLCLAGWLGHLKFFRPLIRDVNWGAIGPVLSVGGSPSVVDHPRQIWPAGAFSSGLGLPIGPLAAEAGQGWSSPVDVGELSAGAVVVGQAAGK